MKFQWNTKYFGWEYLNYVIIVLGLIVGLSVWFMPNKWADPEIKAAGVASKRRCESCAASGWRVKLKRSGYRTSWALSISIQARIPFRPNRPGRRRNRQSRLSWL